MQSITQKIHLFIYFQHDFYFYSGIICDSVFSVGQARGSCVIDKTSDDKLCPHHLNTTA